MFGAVVVVILWKLDLQLPVQSVPITTNIVSTNPVHGEMKSVESDVKHHIPQTTLWLFWKYVTSVVHPFFNEKKVAL